MRVERRLPALSPPHEAVVLSHLAAQGLHPRSSIRLYPVVDQIGQLLRVSLPAYQRLQDGLAALAQNVREDTGQLEVGVLQRLLDALDVLRLLPHQLLARTCQVPQAATGRSCARTRSPGSARRSSSPAPGH